MDLEPLKIDRKPAKQRKARGGFPFGKLIFLLLVVGAVAAGNNAGYNDYGSQIGAVALAVGGAAAIKGAMGDSKQAKAHKETLSELGKSLNTEIAPKVMELEDTEIELKGSAQEQYSTWREALRRVYEQEQVPDVAL